MIGITGTLDLKTLRNPWNVPCFGPHWHLVPVVGFILVLLVTLSVPIIHSINMIHASQTVTGSSSSLGVFGACYTQAQNL
jgi:hypothetical protein